VFCAVRFDVVWIKRTCSRDGNVRKGDDQRAFASQLFVLARVVAEVNSSASLLLQTEEFSGSELMRTLLNKLLGPM